MFKIKFHLLTIIDLISSDGNISFERQSTKTSNNMIRNAKVVEEYLDVDGGLYLWMVGK